MVLFAFLVSNMLALHFFFCEILKFKELETPGSMVLMVWMDQEIWASSDAQISSSNSHSSTRSGHAMLEYMCGIIRTTVQKVQNIQHKILFGISTSTPCFLMFLAWPSLILGLHSIKCKGGYGVALYIGLCH
jgi:hypothetical protein